MNHRLSCIRSLSIRAALALAVGTGGIILSSTFPAAASETQILAEAPARFSDRVTDYTGTLSTSEIADIESAINVARTEHQREIFVVFLDSFDGVDPNTWTKQAVALNGGGNVLIYAVSPTEREFGIYGGSQWTDAELDQAYDGAYQELLEDNFAASAVAVAQSLGGGSIDGSSAAWLGAAGVGVVAAGGGLWAYNRNRTKKQSAKTLADARDIDPRDTNQLASLPIETLESLAQEELSAADESIRRAQEELATAQAEFGPERTRSFTRAMNNSTGTLQKAFSLQQRLNDSIPESEAEKRALLVDIISSCGQADDALAAESKNFAQMRNLLITADAKLDELTQKTIDIQTRLPKVSATIIDLRSRYSESVLESINDNVDLASSALGEADKTMPNARELAAKPAGQQGGLIDAIRHIEHAVSTADKLLEGVEHADENIATARANVADLITEIEEEITEAAQLKNRAGALGTKADWNALDQAVLNATAAIRTAREESHIDPLGTYTELIAIDSALDTQLDAVRETAANQERQLRIFDSQLQSAAKQIQNAEDLISTRGRIIKSEARTHLENSKKLFAMAQQNRIADTRQATDYARQSAVAAQRATKSARSDINDYNNRMNRNNSSGTGGAIVAGMVINSILNSGGGFGGGGGGFSGGGGGGGGFRGGRF